MEKLKIDVLVPPEEARIRMEQNRKNRKPQSGFIAWIKQFFGEGF